MERQQRPKVGQQLQAKLKNIHSIMQCLSITKNSKFGLSLIGLLMKTKEIIFRKRKRLKQLQLHIQQSTILKQAKMVVKLNLNGQLQQQKIALLERVSKPMPHSSLKKQTHGHFTMQMNAAQILSAELHSLAMDFLLHTQCSIVMVLHTEWTMQLPKCLNNVLADTIVNNQ